MKFTILFSMALMLCSIKNYADQISAVKNIHDSNHYNYLAINNSPINQLLLVHDLTITTVDSSPTAELPAQILGQYQSQLLSIEAGVIQLSQESNWSRYYFQGALTLHQYDKFNLSLMANIEQINNFQSLYFVNNHYQTPYVENLTIPNETELNYSYGVVGSYSVNATWQVSGGIMHGQAIDTLNSITWYGNKNIALIGTTYSF
jgi:hypothetical protein